MSDGISAVNPGIDATNHGIRAMSHGGGTRSHGTDAVSHGIDAMTNGAHAMNHGIRAVNDCIVASMDGIHTDLCCIDAMIRRTILSLVLLFAMNAAAAPKPITVTGTLIEGVECQALRQDQTNKVFTLTSVPQGFANGDHVTVTGTPVEISICQQGTTISVTKMAKTV